VGISAVGTFFISPEKGAETSIYLATSPEIEGVTGKYFANCHEKRPSANARDEELAERLWTFTAKFVSELNVELIQHQETPPKK
jgi:hypothetical protein